MRSLANRLVNRHGSHMKAANTTFWRNINW